MEETSTKVAFTELDHDLLGDWLEGADHLHDICGNYSLNIAQVMDWATRPDVELLLTRITTLMKLRAEHLLAEARIQAIARLRTIMERATNYETSRRAATTLLHMDRPPRRAGTSSPTVREGSPTSTDTPQPPPSPSDHTHPSAPLVAHAPSQVPDAQSPVPSSPPSVLSVPSVVNCLSLPVPSPQPTVLSSAPSRNPDSPAPIHPSRPNPPSGVDLRPSRRRARCRHAGTLTRHALCVSMAGDDHPPTSFRPHKKTSMTTPDSPAASPATTPAAAPATAPALTADMMAEAEVHMQQAMNAPPPAPKTTAASAAPKPAIRGPRVVQAGREHRHGKVVSVGPTDIFLEFGPKELGVLPRLQFPEDKDLPVVGTEFEVVIDKFEPGENIFLCSRPGMVQKADWEMLEAGQVVEARVTGVVTGKEGKPAGLELEVAGHRAFMPASQASLDRVADLTVFVGEKMKCQVARVERMGKGNIVLSRRDILEQEREENAKKLRATLQEGQTVEGTVRKIMPFGVFVDIGGVDGLVHISDVTYDRVGFGERAVSKYVKEGQKVNVRILKIEPESNRISLGIKQVAGDPFATATNSLVEGAEVAGRVTRMAEFGAFVELAPGVDGLVHISEIDWKRIGKVEDALKIDEIIRAKILKIDPQNRRISLSIKALKAPPEMPAPKQDEGAPQGAGRGGPGGGGGGRGFGGGGFGGGRGGFGGGRGKDKIQGRSAEEILKETPALRRAREKNKQVQFKGGLG